MSEKFALARLLLFLLTLKTSYLLLFLKSKTEIEEEDQKGKSPLLQLIKFIIERLFLLRPPWTIPGIIFYVTQRIKPCVKKKQKKLFSETLRRTTMPCSTFSLKFCMATQGRLCQVTDHIKKFKCLSLSAYFLLQPNVNTNCTFQKSFLEMSPYFRGHLVIQFKGSISYLHLQLGVIM